MLHTEATGCELVIEYVRVDVAHDLLRLVVVAGDYRPLLGECGRTSEHRETGGKALAESSEGL